MQKVIYLLTDSQSSGDDLRDRLLTETAPALVSAGSLGVQVNVADSDVSPASGSRLRSDSGPNPDAMVSVWLNSANPTPRGVFDGVIEVVDETFAAYLVAESEPLRSPPHQGRTPGYSQIAFLQRPAHLEQATWRAHWLGHHTRVAIESQSTFRYVQNQVLWPLTPTSPHCDGIVEECFPEAAMSNPAVFFDSVDDPDLLQHNMDAMMASVAEFLDLARLDVVPTSEYVVSPPRFG